MVPQHALPAQHGMQSYQQDAARTQWEQQVDGTMGSVIAGHPPVLAPRNQPHGNMLEGTGGGLHSSVAVVKCEHRPAEGSATSYRAADARDGARGSAGRGSMPPKASSKSSAPTFRCNYCGKLKQSSCKPSDGRVRIRCMCGGKHKDGESRLHTHWSEVPPPGEENKPTSSVVAGSSGGALPVVKQELVDALDVEMSRASFSFEV